MSWLHRIRLKVLAVVLGLFLAVIGTLTLTAWPAIPVVGVAVLTVAAIVNTMTGRLNERLCHHCGEPLEEAAAGQYGLICENCGGINSQPPTRA